MCLEKDNEVGWRRRRSKKRLLNPVSEDIKVGVT